MRTLSDGELDAAYTHLCHTLTRLGPEQAEPLLSRLALLALARSASGADALKLVDDAALDLPATR
jgi:hypothetical protein